MQPFTQNELDSITVENVANVVYNFYREVRVKWKSGRSPNGSGSIVRLYDEDMTLVTLGAWIDKISNAGIPCFRPATNDPAFQDV